MRLKEMSIVERYSVYGTIFSVLFVGFIFWLLLVGLAPKKPPMVAEIEIEETIEPVKIDHWSDVKNEARLNGLEPQIAIGVIRSEQIFTPHKEIEGACRMSDGRTECIKSLSKLYKDLTDYIGRKPTSSDVLLAHSFGVVESVRISKLIGVHSIDKLGEDILKANPNLKSFENIRDFRIWLSRYVYRKFR